MPHHKVTINKRCVHTKHVLLLKANQSEQGKIHGLEKAILELLSNFRSIHDLILVKCRP